MKRKIKVTIIFLQRWKTYFESNSLLSHLVMVPFHLWLALHVLLVEPWISNLFWQKKEQVVSVVSLIGETQVVFPCSSGGIVSHNSPKKEKVKKLRKIAFARAFDFLLNFFLHSVNKNGNQQLLLVLLLILVSSLY